MLFYAFTDINDNGESDMEMKRIFERNNLDETGFEHNKVTEKIKVGIVGCGRGSGATFVATSLSYFASKIKKREAAFVQLDGRQAVNTLDRIYKKTDVYDALGMDKRFSGREFIDFFERISKEKSIKGFKNTDDRVNWIIEIPSDIASLNNGLRMGKSLNSAVCTEGLLSDIDYLRLINNVSGDFIVCDFGDEGRMDKCGLYRDMDELICVIDPMPSKLLDARELISYVKQLSTRGHKVSFLINKVNPGVNRRELRDFLKGEQVLFPSGSRRNYYEIPLIDERLFYSCQYNCDIPANNKDIRRETENTFLEILENMM